jgi:hypothetical protein
MSIEDFGSADGAEHGLADGVLRGLEKSELVLLDFVLRKRGMRLDYRVQRMIRRGRMTMMGEVVEKSPFPPTGHLMAMIRNLRVDVARALSLWYDGFDRYLSSDGDILPFDRWNDDGDYMKALATLDAIDIVKVSFMGGYRFEAMVETIPGKTVKMRTPLITEDDEDIFEAISAKMDLLNSTMVSFIEDSSYDVVSEAKSIVERLVGKESVETMSEKEIFLMAIERVEALGGVVMYSEELEREIEEARRELPLLRTGTAEGADVEDRDAVDESVQAWATKERGYEKDFDSGAEANEEPIEEEEFRIIERTEESLRRVDDGDHSPQPFDVEETEEVEESADSFI